MSNTEIMRSMRPNGGAGAPAQLFPRREPAPPPLPSNSFTRMLAAKAIADYERRKPEQVLAQRWPSEKALEQHIVRAASAPAMTTVPGWAQELVQQKIVTEGLAALGPMSAGAQLLRAGLVLSFDRAGFVTAPGFVADAANGGFVAEGQPIPVRQLNATPARVDFHKLCSIGVVSREMMDSSNAEVLIGDALLRSAALALDAALFDANPATAARPAGLRNGIANLVASNNADMGEAFFQDMASLVNATAAVGGPGPYAIIVNPGRAVGLAMHFIFEVRNVVVFATPAVGNDIIVVALAALVSAGGDPEVESATASALHMNDVPQPIGTASPARSMFQTETIALKMRWPLSWSLRDSRGVAWLTPSWK